MPALNFKQQFVEPIRSGRKKHTIRAKRKHPISAGFDDLYLYCGMRTKNCFAILEGGQYCSQVQDIIIRECGRCDGTGEVACSSTHYESCPVFEVIVDGVFLGRDECERLAYADGFESFAEMMKFWKGRLPFEGNIIHWK
jgi:hypothetical protein